MPWKPCLIAILLAVLSAEVAEPAETVNESSSAQRIPDVMYIPTPPDVVDAMLRLAHVNKHDVVCDLGCGDGRILIAAAGNYQCRAIGCDIDPLRIAAARKNVREGELEHLIRIEQQNLFEVDLRSATVVTLAFSS